MGINHSSLLTSIIDNCEDITERIPQDRLMPIPFDFILHKGATNLSLAQSRDLDCQELQDIVVPYVASVIRDRSRVNSMRASDRLNASIWNCMVIPLSTELL